MSSLHVVASFLLLSAAAKGHVGRTLWVVCNLLDTLRSLKEVRANGRKVGVTTRRKLIKQCLVGWIVFVAAQPVGHATDVALFWFPFYKSIKMLVILVLIIWRLQTSGMIFESFIAPALQRHEKHIDLTILLVHSSYALLAFFFVYLPWQLTRALLVAVGIVADASEPTHHPGGDGSSDDGGGDVRASSPIPRKLKPSLKSPLVKQKHHSTRSTPDRSGDAAETKCQAPAKSPVSKIVSERKAIFEQPAANVAEPPAAAEKQGRPRVQPPVHKAPTAAATRRTALRKPPMQAESSSAPTRRTAAAAAAPTVRKTMRKPSATAPKTEELLLALPAPPSNIPTTSRPQNVPSSSHPMRPVDATGDGPLAHASGSRNALSPPKKRGRPKATDDDGSNSDRPVKRTATTRTTSTARASKPAATTSRATARATAPARTRVVSDSRPKDKPPSETIPKTKRTRSAAATTTPPTSAIPDSSAATKRTRTK